MGGGAEGVRVVKGESGCAEAAAGIQSLAQFAMFSGGAHFPSPQAPFTAVWTTAAGEGCGRDPRHALRTRRHRPTTEMRLGRWPFTCSSRWSLALKEGGG